MRILLTGATGFIGRHLAAALVARGHTVIGCARDRYAAFKRYPNVGWMRADFATDQDVHDWLPRLAGFNAVINAAGILHARPGQSFDAVHVAGPRALFAACARRGIGRVIHISALGCNPRADRPYQSSKLELESILATFDMNWTVVRPSLVFGDGNDAIATLRALARLPVVPLIGDGSQRLQPIHIDDFCLAVARLLEAEAPARRIVELAGPRAVAFREMMAELRRLETPAPAYFIGVPLSLLRIAATLAGFVGRSALSHDHLDMLERGNVASDNGAARLLGRAPRDLRDFEEIAASCDDTGILRRNTG
jgi:nucleoside-diphosphate-sugar epimerase